MNNLLIAAGAFGLFTTAVHIFGGQINPIRPFLQTDLADDVKGCLLVCWHMVSAYLLLTSCLFVTAGLDQRLVVQHELELLLNAVASFYVLFALMFIAVGWYFYSYRTIYKLPQWILLLPIGILGLMGTYSL